MRYATEGCLSGTLFLYTENMAATVQDIMQTEVIAVPPAMSVSEVAQTLQEHGIHGVPVVDTAGQVAGIITESDFFIKEKVMLYLPSYIDVLQKMLLRTAIEPEDRAEAEALLNATAETIMTTPCVTVLPQLPLESLAIIFQEKRFRSVPVVDEMGHLVGIVSLFDLLPHLSVQ